MGKVVQWKHPGGAEFSVLDETSVNVHPRSPLMQSLIGQYQDPPRPIEELTFETMQKILGYRSDRLELKTKLRPEDSQRLYDMAQTYVRYRDQNARLPAFPRWVASMFKDDKLLQQVLGEIGQMKNDAKVLYISGEAKDFSRSAQSTCLSSCLNIGVGRVHDILKACVVESGGTLVAFTEKDNGEMLGRAFLLEGIEEKTGRPVVQINNPYGQLKAQVIAKAIKERNPDIVVVHRGARANERYAAPAGGDKVLFKYTNSIKSSHYDFMNSSNNKDVWQAASILPGK